MALVERDTTVYVLFLAVTIASYDGALFWPLEAVLATACKDMFDYQIDNHSASLL
jgi:hypothetical protein